MEKKMCTPKNFSQNTKGKALIFFPIECEQGTTESYLATMSESLFKNETNNWRDQSYTG